MSRPTVRFSSLLSEQLGGGQKSEAQSEADSAQANKPGESNVTNISLQATPSYSQREIDTTNDISGISSGARIDVESVPLDITSDTKPPEPSTSTVIESAGRGTPKAIDEGLQQSQSDEWTTDDETLNWLEQELAKQNSDTSKESPVHMQNKSGWAILSEKKKPHRTMTASRRDDEVVIHRGFGCFTILPQSAAHDGNPRSFPPLSNAAYDLTTYGVDPKIHARSSKRIVVDELNSTAANAYRTGADGATRTFDGNVSGMLERPVLE